MGRPHKGRKMDRLATAIMIALAALVMNGGILRDVMAEEAGMRIPAPHQAVQKSQLPAASGLRSERVMSLLLTLEALRAAPALLDTSKV
jgi:Na+/alanine symporter